MAATRCDEVVGRTPATFENHQVTPEHMSGGSRDRSHYTKLCPSSRLCCIFRMDRWLFSSAASLLMMFLAVEWRDRLQLHKAEPPPSYIIKPVASSPTTDSLATRPWLLMRGWWVALVVGGWVWPVGGRWVGGTFSVSRFCLLPQPTHFKLYSFRFQFRREVFLGSVNSATTYATCRQQIPIINNSIRKAFFLTFSLNIFSNNFCSWQNHDYWATIKTKKLHLIIRKFLL